MLSNKDKPPAVIEIFDFLTHQNIDSDQKNKFLI